MSSEHGEEQALINSARLGDEAALEALIRTHAPRLLRLAYGILGEHQGAEDAVQDALIDAWKGLSNFRGDAALATWLHTITVRTCRRHAACAARAAGVESWTIARRPRRCGPTPTTRWTRSPSSRGPLNASSYNTP